MAAEAKIEIFSRLDIDAIKNNEVDRAGLKSALDEANRISATAAFDAQSKPAKAEFYVKRAYILLALNQFDAALAENNEAKKLKLSKLNNRNTRAMISTQEQYIRDRIAQISAEVQKSVMPTGPNDVDKYIQYAVILRSKNSEAYDLNRAFVCYKKAFTLSKFKNLESLFGQIAILPALNNDQTTQNNDQAIQLLLGFLLQAPLLGFNLQNPWVLSDSFVSKQDTDAVLAVCNAALAADPNNADLVLAKAFVLYVSGNHKDAFTYFCTAAKSFDQSQQNNKALQAYNMALKINPKHLATLVGRFELLCAMHNYKAALLDLGSIEVASADGPGIAAGFRKQYPAVLAAAEAPPTAQAAPHPVDDGDGGQADNPPAAALAADLPTLQSAPPQQVVLPPVIDGGNGGAQPENSPAAAPAADLPTSQPAPPTPSTQSNTANAEVKNEDEGPVVAATAVEAPPAATQTAHTADGGDGGQQNTPPAATPTPDNLSTPQRIPPAQSRTAPPAGDHAENREANSKMRANTSLEQHQKPSTRKKSRLSFLVPSNPLRRRGSDPTLKVSPTKSKKKNQKNAANHADHTRGLGAGEAQVFDMAKFEQDLNTLLTQEPIKFAEVAILIASCPDEQVRAQYFLKISKIKEAQRVEKEKEALLQRLETEARDFFKQDQLKEALARCAQILQIDADNEAIVQLQLQIGQKQAGDRAEYFKSLAAEARGIFENNKENKDWRRSLDLCESVLKADPHNQPAKELHDEIIEYALDEKAAGLDLKEACEICNRILGTNLNHQAALDAKKRAISRALDKASKCIAQDWESAWKIYQSILEEDPHNQDAILQRANNFYSLLVAHLFPVAQPRNNVAFLESLKSFIDGDQYLLFSNTLSACNAAAIQFPNKDFTFKHALLMHIRVSFLPQTRRAGMEQAALLEYTTTATSNKPLERINAHLGIAILEGDPRKADAKYHMVLSEYLQNPLIAPEIGDSIRSALGMLQAPPADERKNDSNEKENSSQSEWERAARKTSKNKFTGDAKQEEEAWRNGDFAVVAKFDPNTDGSQNRPATASIFSEANTQSIWLHLATTYSGLAHSAVHNKKQLYKKAIKAYEKALETQNVYTKEDVSWKIVLIEFARYTLLKKLANDSRRTLRRAPTPSFASSSSSSSSPTPTSAVDSSSEVDNEISKLQDTYGYLFKHLESVPQDVLALATANLIDLSSFSEHKSTFLEHLKAYAPQKTPARRASTAVPADESKSDISASSTRTRLTPPPRASSAYSSSDSFTSSSSSSTPSAHLTGNTSRPTTPFSPQDSRSPSPPADEIAERKVEKTLPTPQYNSDPTIAVEEIRAQKGLAAAIVFLNMQLALEKIDQAFYEAFFEKMMHRNPPDILSKEAIARLEKAHTKKKKKAKSKAAASHPESKADHQNSPTVSPESTAESQAIAPSLEVGADEQKNDSALSEPTATPEIPNVETAISKHLAALAAFQTRKEPDDSDAKSVIAAYEAATKAATTEDPQHAFKARFGHADFLYLYAQDHVRFRLKEDRASDLKKAIKIYIAILEAKPAVLTSWQKAITYHALANAYSDLEELSREMKIENLLTSKAETSIENYKLAVQHYLTYLQETSATDESCALQMKLAIRALGCFPQRVIEGTFDADVALILSQHKFNANIFAALTKKIDPELDQASYLSAIAAQEAARKADQSQYKSHHQKLLDEFSNLDLRSLLAAGLIDHARHETCRSAMTPKARVWEKGDPNANKPIELAQTNEEDSSLTLLARVALEEIIHDQHMVMVQQALQAANKSAADNAPATALEVKESTAQVDNASSAPVGNTAVASEVKESTAQQKKASSAPTVEMLLQDYGGFLIRDLLKPEEAELGVCLGQATLQLYELKQTEGQTNIEEIRRLKEIAVSLDEEIQSLEKRAASIEEKIKSLEKSAASSEPELRHNRQLKSTIDLQTAAAKYVLYDAYRAIEKSMLQAQANGSAQEDSAPVQQKIKELRADIIKTYLAALKVEAKAKADPWEPLPLMPELQKQAVLFSLAQFLEDDVLETKITKRLEAALIKKDIKTALSENNYDADKPESMALLKAKFPNLGLARLAAANLVNAVIYQKMFGIQLITEASLLELKAKRDEALKSAELKVEQPEPPKTPEPENKGVSTVEIVTSLKLAKNKLSSRWEDWKAKRNTASVPAVVVAQPVMKGDAKEDGGAANDGGNTPVESTTVVVETRNGEDGQPDPAVMPANSEVAAGPAAADHAEANTPETEVNPTTAVDQPALAANADGNSGAAKPDGNAVPTASNTNTGSGFFSDIGKRWSSFSANVNAKPAASATPAAGQNNKQPETGSSSSWWKRKPKSATPKYAVMNGAAAVVGVEGGAGVVGEQVGAAEGGVGARELAVAGNQAPAADGQPPADTTATGVALT